MKVEKKVTISFTKEEQIFLRELNYIIDSEVCHQYDKCIGCPFNQGTNSCTTHNFFNELEAISNYLYE